MDQLTLMTPLSTVNIFSGYENSLEMSQLYTVTYTCDFDLVMFPFDSQVNL